MADITGLLQLFDDARETLIEAVDGLEERARDDERWYGEWTVKDIICHIAAWEEVWAMALEAVAEGNPIGRPPHHADDGLLNERIAHAHYYNEWDESLEYLSEARQRLLGALFEVELVTLDLAGGDELVRELEVEVTHQQEHAGAIARWRKERGL